MARVAPSERFRRELDDVLAGVDGEADPVERIGRLGARLILQQALEDEVSEFLGRARYERAIDPVSHEAVRPSVCEAEATGVMSVGQSVSEVDLERGESACPGAHG